VTRITDRELRLIMLPGVKPLRIHAVIDNCIASGVQCAASFIQFLQAIRGKDEKASSLPRYKLEERCFGSTYGLNPP